MKKSILITGLLCMLINAFGQESDKKPLILSQAEKAQIIRIYEHCGYSQTDFESDIGNDSISIITASDRFIQLPDYLSRQIEYKYVRLSDFRLYVSINEIIKNDGQDTKSLILPDASVNFYAVIVGINDYGTVWKNLQGCVTDAENIYNALTQIYGIQPSNIRLRTDKILNTGDNVTSTILEQDLQWLAQNADENDVALFYFSGHGTDSEDNTIHALEIKDGDYLYDFEIETVLDEIRAETKIVILDACRSGGIREYCFDVDNWIIAAAAENENSRTGFFLSNPVGISGSVFTSWFYDALTYYQSAGRTAIEKIMYSGPVYSQNPDDNLDNKISLREAFSYAKECTESLWLNLVLSTFHPEMSPSSGDIGIGKYYVSKPDLVPPTVKSILYNKDDLSTNIKVVFSKNLNLNTLSAGTVILQGDKTGNYTFSHTFDGSTNTLTIDPTGNLKNGENIILTLTTGIRDLKGNLLDGDSNGMAGPNYNHSFTTSGFTHDYTVTDLTLSKSNPIVGEVVVVTAKIKNIGKVTEPANQLVYLYDNGQRVNTYYYFPSLAAGAETNHSFNWTATAGPHDLKVEIDLAADENQSNDYKSVSLFAGVAGNLKIDGVTNPSRSYTVSVGKNIDPVVQLENSGSASISGTISKSGNVSNWITLSGGTSFNLSPGQSVPYSFRITVPAGTGISTYTATITFTYDGGTKTNSIQLTIPVVESKPGLFEYNYSGSYSIDGRWTKTHGLYNSVGGSTGFYLDNNNSTSDPIKADPLSVSITEDDYKRMYSAEWITNMREDMQASSSTGVWIGVSESGKGKSFSSTTNTTTDISTWIARGKTNNFTCMLNYATVGAANVKWWINQSMITLKFGTSGWGGDCPIPSADLTAAKAGWNTGRIYFRVDAVTAPGVIKLYNNGTQLSTTSISSSDAGSIKYLTFTSSKTYENNYWVINSDASAGTRVTISNIRVEIKYFLGDPNLACTKVLSKNEALINEPVTLTLNFENTGSNIANRTSYNDSPLPAGLSLKTGILTDMLDDIYPLTAAPVQYTISATQPGLYNFGASSVNYENQSRSKSYQTTFNSVSLLVSGGNQLIEGSLDKTMAELNDKVQVKAIVKGSITNAPISGAKVSCTVKNLTTGAIFTPFFLLYNTSTQSYEGEFTETYSRGDYEVTISSECDYYSKGTSPSPLIFKIPYINLSNSYYLVDMASSFETASISSNIVWTASTTASWISLSNITPSTFRINYDQNNTGQPRSSVVTVEGEGISKMIIIDQKSDIATGTDKVNLSGIKVFPNPTSGIINFVSNEALYDRIFIKVLDITGKVLISNSVPEMSAGELHTIDISFLRTGTYLLYIDNGERELVFRIIKKQ